MSAFTKMLREFKSRWLTHGFTLSESMNICSWPIDVIKHTHTNTRYVWQFESSQTWRCVVERVLPDMLTTVMPSVQQGTNACSKHREPLSEHLGITSQKRNLSKPQQHSCENLKSRTFWYVYCHSPPFLTSVCRWASPLATDKDILQNVGQSNIFVLR